MLEGGHAAAQADEDVVGASQLRELEKRVTRGGGATTSLEVKQLGSGTGKDDCTPGASSSSAQSRSLPTHETLG